MHRSDTAELVQLTLGDFRIQHSELQFGGTLVDTETGGIHTGRGRLSVISRYGTISTQVARRGRHTQLQAQGRRGGRSVYRVQCADSPLQVRAWLATVRCLAHIRHESVLLYMGAAVDPPRFAIVTSPVKVGQLSGDIHHTVLILPGTIPGLCTQPRPRTQLQHQGGPS